MELFPEYQPQATRLRPVLKSLADRGTYFGTSSNTNLTGSNWGSSLFELGAGNDSVTGGSGSNTIEYSSSVAHATINVTGASGITNELDFGASTSVQSLWFEQHGNDLQIDVLGTSSQVTIANWYEATAHQLQEITADGYQLDSEISGLVSAMATYAANNPAFDPASASQLPSDAALQAEIQSAWHHA